MKVEKRERQIVVTPPPTFDITGLTEMDVALLKAITSNTHAAVNAVAQGNTFVRDNRVAAVKLLTDIRTALRDAEPRGVWPLQASFDTNRDAGDETKS